MAITKTQDGGDVETGKFYQMVLYSAINSNQLGLNTIFLYTAAEAGAPAGSLGDFALDFYQNLYLTWRALMPSQVRLLGCKCSDVTTPVRLLPGIATDTATLGSFGTLAQGPQVSGIITWNTGLSGKAYRGRSYIPFPSITAVDTDNTPTAAYVTALTDHIGALLGYTTFTSGFGNWTITPVIYHRKNTPPTGSAILAGLGRKRFATQKRRGNYGRLNATVIS